MQGHRVGVVVVRDDVRRGDDLLRGRDRSRMFGRETVAQALKQSEQAQLHRARIENFSGETV
jgi:hypothetical protein